MSGYRHRRLRQRQPFTVLRYRSSSRSVAASGPGSPDTAGRVMTESYVPAHRRAMPWIVGAAAATCVANVHRAASDGSAWLAMGWALLAGYWFMILGIRIALGTKR